MGGIRDVTNYQRATQYTYCSSNIHRLGWCRWLLIGASKEALRKHLCRLANARERERERERERLASDYEISTPQVGCLYLSDSRFGVGIHLRVLQE